MFQTCWRELEDRWKFDKAFLLDNTKFHIEKYEFWYYKLKYLKSQEEFDAVEDSETAEKYSYQIKNVPQYTYWVVVRWYRHPNHWE